MISLYFHIPFCTKKCDYCHFYVLPDKQPFHQLLMEGLFLDIDAWAAELKDKQLVSIYFGGGTPSLLGAAAIAQLLDKVRSYLHFRNEEIEITLEANPDTVTPTLIKEYAQAGINRISIGIQSLDNQLLKKLGRLHSAQTAIDSIHTIAEEGIKNISIDLMYDIPCQTLLTWQNTLKQAVELPITHLSLYNLTIEPHTVFFKYRESLLKDLPDAECSTEMYKMATEMLNQNGLIQYEISAFAKNNLYSRHNVGYWTARPFLGFGPSAFSYWKGERFRAVANLNRYVQALRDKTSPIDFDEKLLPLESRRELLVIALRMRAGVNLKEFQKQHGLLDQDTINIIDRLKNEGLLHLDENVVGLTDRGVLFYDSIASDLI